MKIKTINVLDAAAGDILMFNINQVPTLVKILACYPTLKTLSCKLYDPAKSIETGEECWSKEYSVSVETLVGVVKLVDDADLTKEEVKEVAQQTKPWFDNKTILGSYKQTVLNTKTNTTTNDNKAN